MSEIPAFQYNLLWEERQLTSVANLTRQDAREFIAAVRSLPLKVDAHPYPLGSADVAMSDLRDGRIQGAAVLVA